MKVKVAQSCPTLCDPMDCSPPGSSVLGILQARTLEWVAILFYRGSSWPRGWTRVFCIAGKFLLSEPSGKPLYHHGLWLMLTWFWYWQCCLLYYMWPSDPAENFILLSKSLSIWFGLPRWLSGKESACHCRRHKRCRFDPWVRKIPWRRKWQPTCLENFMDRRPWWVAKNQTQLSNWAHMHTSIWFRVPLGTINSCLISMHLRDSVTLLSKFKALVGLSYFDIRWTILWSSCHPECGFVMRLGRHVARYFISTMIHWL